MSRINSIRARQKLRRILQATDPGALREVMVREADDLRDEMKNRVPVDTGNLRDNISSFVSKNGEKAEVGFRGKRARRDSWYARFIEFGTKGYSGEKYRRKNSSSGAMASRSQSDKNKTDGVNWFGKYPDIPARAAKPFIGPSWDAKKPQFVKAVNLFIEQAIKKAQGL